MKNVLKQSLVKFIVGLIALTCIIASVSIYFENNSYNRPILATCYWDAIAKTWIDENANQIWDENELPLAGVQIIVDGIQMRADNSEFRYTFDSQPFTDHNGFAQLSGVLQCGTTFKYEIYAKPPSGYKFTTQEKIALETSPHKKVFVFGFSKK